MSSRYYTIIPFPEYELILLENYDAIGFFNDPEINPETVSLRGGTLVSGDLISEIKNTSSKSAGFTGFYPACWLAKYVGTVSIVINEDLCRHVCFQAVDLAGKPINSFLDTYRHGFICFALLDQDLHFTTKCHSSRLVVCDEIIKARI